MTRYLARAFALALFAVAGCAPTVQAPPATPPSPTGPIVGGATMRSDFTLWQNLQASSDHRIFIGGATASGHGSTLAAAGSYTVFAPPDAAFRRLANGTVEALMDPRSRQELSGVIGYHIVPGAKTRAQIAADARAAGGTAIYRTQQGQTLRVALQGETIVLTDMNGRRNQVTQGDIAQANGVLYVVDGVLLPQAY